MRALLEFPVRSLAWLAFFAAVLGAWLWLYLMAVGMDLDMIGRPGERGAIMQAMDPRMDMYMPMASFWPLAAMWAVMMAAMMGPTFVPTLSTYETLITAADGTRNGWYGLVLGYFAVWIAAAFGFAGLQLALLFSGVIDMLGIAKSLWISGVLLVVVGLFQFTWVKEVCHGVCHSPMSYFLGHWKTGFSGGARMGLGLGAYCLGCCWGFMALGFVGGTMSLLWMGLATFVMVLEKLPQVAHYVVRPVGVLLILAGLGVIGAAAGIVG